MASGCAYVDIHLVGAGDDVFASTDFHQHLSVYDGLCTAKGKGVTAQVLAWPHRDVMAVEVEDARSRPDAIDAEHIGGLISGIHETMLSSSPEEPDGDPVLRIFNDWPKSWGAAFTLLARGAFLVSSSMQTGQIEFVQIRSNAGEECHLRNPWPDKTVTLHRDGRKAEDLSGSLLTFPTTKSETVVIVPRGSTVARRKVL